MTDAVHELLDKSKRSISAANLLLRDGYYDFAASRAYYAMFYAVEALMLDRDLSFISIRKRLRWIANAFRSSLDLCPSMIYRRDGER